MIMWHSAIISQDIVSPTPERLAFFSLRNGKRALLSLHSTAVTSIVSGAASAFRAASAARLPGILHLFQPGVGELGRIAVPHDLRRLSVFVLLRPQALQKKNCRRSSSERASVTSVNGSRNIQHGTYPLIALASSQFGSFPLPGRPGMYGMMYGRKRFTHGYQANFRIAQGDSAMASCRAHHSRTCESATCNFDP